jgi:hypothetical protein
MEAEMLFAVLLALLRTVPAEVSFEPWFTERDVAVSIARVADGKPWIRAVVELPAPAERVLAVVSDYDDYLRFFDPAVSRAAVLEAEGDSARVHFVWPYPFPFRDRDGIVAYDVARLPEGAFLLSFRNAARPGDPKVGVRIERIAGETRIEPLGPDRCRVTYTYLGELGGNFPRAAEETAWRHAPIGYVHAIRRALDLPIPPG